MLLAPWETLLDQGRALPEATEDRSPTMMVWEVPFGPEEAGIREELGGGPGGPEGEDAVGGTAVDTVAGAVVVAGVAGVQRRVVGLDERASGAALPDVVLLDVRQQVVEPRLVGLPLEPADGRRQGVVQG